MARSDEVAHIAAQVQRLLELPAAVEDAEAFWADASRSEKGVAWAPLPVTPAGWRQVAYKYTRWLKYHAKVEPHAANRMTKLLRSKDNVEAV